MKIDFLRKIGKSLSCDNLNIFNKNIAVIENSDSPEKEKECSRKTLSYIIISKFCSSKYYEELKTTGNKQAFDDIIASQLINPNSASESDFFDLIFFLENTIKKYKPKHFALNRKSSKGQLIKPILIGTSCIAIYIGGLVYNNSQPDNKPESTTIRPTLTVETKSNDIPELNIKSFSEYPIYCPTPGPNEPKPTLTVVPSDAETIPTIDDVQIVLSKIR